VAAQRYRAVLAVIADGFRVKQVAEKTGVSRQTLHAWLARYEAAGLEGLVMGCSSTGCLPRRVRAHPCRSSCSELSPLGYGCRLNCCRKRRVGGFDLAVD
jgi:transposase-like protein